MHEFAAPLLIGVTSHRDLVGGELESIRGRIRTLFEHLSGEFPQMPLVVLSSLAEGGDQLVAEEALGAGARLIAALPMARAEYARDFSDSAARSRFESLCDAADIVVEVPHLAGSTLGAGEDSPEGHARDAHYAEAGVYVSDHCHLLLAIWDGKSSASFGGTAQIVRYHLSGVRPAPGERRRERRSALGYGSERLAYQIVCSRDRPDGAPLPSLRALDTSWRTGDAMIPGDGPMPEAFHAMFAHADAFNFDSAKYAAKIETHAGLMPADRAGNAASDAIDRLFRAADWLAIHFQRRVVLAMRVLYTLAALMAISFAVYDNVPSQDNMLYVFLVLFAIGGYIVTLANRRGWHRKYLDYRALAEGLRVQSYWRRAGIPLTDDTEFARDNFLQKQDVELGWVRNVMRGAALEDGRSGRTGEPHAVAHVIDEWIGDGERGGQLEYYRRKAAQRARTHRFTEGFGLASLCVGIGISVVLAIFARRLSPDAKNILVMVMAVFSIVAGVRAAYAYKKADKELIKQYRYMQHIFGEARTALDGAANSREQREVLRLLGEAALAEQVEWALMHRQRPLEHNRI
jgi:hypothetical protein